VCEQLCRLGAANNPLYRSKVLLRQNAYWDSFHIASWASPRVKLEVNALCLGTQSEPTFQPARVSQQKCLMAMATPSGFYSVSVIGVSPWG